MSDYPRDMVGYGANPPHPHWPGDANIAVQFVMNYEEGGENNILHGDRVTANDHSSHAPQPPTSTPDPLPRVRVLLVP